MNWLLSLLETQWFKGFLSGVVATVLGFVLTIIWDIRKTRDESLERDRVVMNAITEELQSNKRNIEQNLLRLQQELSVLAENRSIVQPLFMMKTGFWDLAKINLRERLLVGDRLTRLRNLAFLAEQVNSEIVSRENYRIHNVAMSNYSTRMRIYDESLVRVLQALAREIAAYEEDESKRTAERGRFYRLLRRRASGKRKSV